MRNRILRARGFLPPPASAASGGVETSQARSGVGAKRRGGGWFSARQPALVSSKGPHPSSTAPRSMPPSPNSLRSRGRDRTLRSFAADQISNTADMACAALGPKISKTTPCTVARKVILRSLDDAISQKHFDRSGKSRALFGNPEIHKRDVSVGASAPQHGFARRNTAARPARCCRALTTCVVPAIACALDSVAVNRIPRNLDRNLR